MKCFVYKVVLCRTERRTQRKENEIKLKVFEVWMRRRMERIKWVDKGLRVN